MSFSNDVKNEVYKTETDNSCCKKAEVYALLLFGNFFHNNDLSFSLKDERLLKRFENLIRGRFSDYFTQNDNIFTVKGTFENNKLFSEFGYNDTVPYIHINDYIVSNPCCMGAFVRGAFLISATVSSFEKEYRAEFKTRYKNLATDLSGLLCAMEDYQIKSRVIQRRGNYIVYIKDAESEEKLLALIGAHRAAMEIMQTRMLNEERNRLNRMNNFDVANISRTATAVARQLGAIKKIESSIGLDKLEEELKAVAKLRLDNPEKSLSELCKLCPGMSRSSLNYRLNKLIKVASKL